MFDRFQENILLNFSALFIAIDHGKIIKKTEIFKKRMLNKYFHSIQCIHSRYSWTSDRDRPKNWILFIYIK